MTLNAIINNELNYFFKRITNCKVKRSFFKYPKSLFTTRHEILKRKLLQMVQNVTEKTDKLTKSHLPFC